jgi:predicted TPR repeat methyltransferase
VPPARLVRAGATLGGVSSCCGCQDVFDDRTARRDLRRYRRRGPSKSTRMLLEALAREGVAGATVLDIGGGVGAIQHELMAAGAARAVGVDASPAYAKVAGEEAARRGHADRVEERVGDFVALAETVEPADIVTLDRVICCYGDMEALVGRSAERSRRLYGLVYPRESWWVRLGLRLANLAMRMRGSAFRAYAHRTSAVDAAARASGLERRLVRRAGPVWQVVVYGR